MSEEKKPKEEKKEEAKAVDFAESATNTQELVSSTDEAGIIISDEVVAQIAGEAAANVKGVNSMSANGLGEMVGIKTKGIKVQVDTKDTVIDVSIIVDYGTRIQDLAWEVQNKVKTEVEMMTGLNVTAVNVHVQGINIPKNKGEQAKQVEEAKVEYIAETTEPENKEDSPIK
jgi:uncharacterized alkaline shock family protein YloU